MVAILMARAINYHIYKEKRWVMAIISWEFYTSDVVISWLKCISFMCGPHFSVFFYLVKQYESYPLFVSKCFGIESGRTGWLVQLSNMCNNKAEKVTRDGSAWLCYGSSGYNVLQSILHGTTWPCTYSFKVVPFIHNNWRLWSAPTFVTYIIIFFYS